MPRSLRMRGGPDSSNRFSRRRQRRGADPRIESKSMTMMQDVLFNTDDPNNSSEPAEFYELSMEADDLNGNEIFVLRERHGWWDSAVRRVEIDQEGKTQIAFQSYRDGLRAYVERMNQRMSQSFVHSFIWHPANGQPSYNQKYEKR